MRNSYLIAFIITLIGALTYWYQSTAALCPAPVSYRVDEIDPRFELSREQALDYATRAEAVWEVPAGRELFVYDESAELAIIFTYDDRQASADSEAMERISLDEQKRKNDEIKVALETLQTKYDQAAATYEKKAAAYETRLRDYNAEVNTYNDRGGAPPEVFERLESERKGLNAEIESLNQISSELRAMADQINELTERGNALVTAYNNEVADYNKAYGYAREFTQGDFQGESINLYKFSSVAEAVTVLAHEFGHSLGIDHVAGTTSLMYYLLENTDEVPKLSSADRVSFEQVCGDTESVAQKVRRMIREMLVNF